MATTAVQKFAAVCMPVAAISLAFLTADPSWSPRRTRWGTWRETMEKAAAEKARKDAPPVAAPDGAPAPSPDASPAAPGAKKDPAPEPAGPAGGTPAPVAEKDPAPEPPRPALPQPEGIEFKVAGLSPCRSGGPLKTAAADRLDITVAVSGAYKVGMNFADPDAMKAAIATAPEAQRKDGLLFLVPNLRSPWDSMKDVLNAGAGAGWARIGIAVGHPDNIGAARVLEVRVPSGDADLPKGTDPMVVKVGVGHTPVFSVNGEDCKDAAVLTGMARGLHDECELMTEGYSDDVERTPWTVDGTGAMVGGVVAALDALSTAGVRTIRILGVQKPADGKTDGESGAEKKKEEAEEPKPGEEPK